MRRYRMAIVAILLHAILMGSVPALAQSTFYTVYVNGVKVSGYPLLRDGVAYLPVNTLAQVLGLNIRWDSSLNIIKVNDRMVAARPLNEEGRIYLPVEAIAQSVGGSVEWDGRNQAIRITSGSGVAASPSETPLTVPVGPVVDRTRPRTQPLPAVTPPTVVLPPYNPPVASYPGQNPSGGYPTPTNTLPYPSPSAYPTPAAGTSLPPVQPPSAQPRMTPNLELPPPVGVQGAGEPPPSYASRTVYVPKTAQNNVFAVTVTNIESVASIKDFYHPRPGHRFVIVYLSQQNVSDEVQIYTGRFSLLDQNNHSHDYIEGLSNFWLVILRPYGINFGYLVFEVPVDSQPTRLALHALNQSPLTLNL